MVIGVARGVSVKVQVGWNDRMMESAESEGPKNEGFR